MVGYASAPLYAAALAAVPLARAYVPFPDPPQPLPQFPPSYDMFDSSIIMPCNYTGPFQTKIAAQWGIADIDWSNSKAQWVNNHPMTSEEELVTAASSIRAVSNRTKVWIYRNLVYAPAWFTDVREKLVSHPQWFVPFKKDGPYVNTKCTLGKCSDLFHSQFQTPEYHSGSVMFGDCKEHCDCGELPCGWYLWNHSNPDCREWLVKEHMMGAMSMGSADVQGNFIDDEWFEYGPELEGPGSESISEGEFNFIYRSISLCHAEVETGDGFAATVGAKNEVVAKSAESDSLCLAEVETGDVLAARVGAKRAREGAARSGATLVANVPALCRGINTPLRVRIKGAHLCWGGISMDLARATTRARAMAAALPRAPRVRVVFPKGAKGRGFWPPLVANIPPPRPKRSLVNQIVRVRPLVRIDGAPRPEDDRLWEYYFTMTYIPDLEWCFLAPLEECGTFSAEFGLAVKGRPRWKTVPEGQGRELHVSARRCTLVTANSVVKSKDADAEEWDIRDY